MVFRVSGFRLRRPALVVAPRQQAFDGPLVLD